MEKKFLELSESIDVQTFLDNIKRLNHIEIPKTK